MQRAVRRKPADRIRSPIGFRVRKFYACSAVAGTGSLSGEVAAGVFRLFHASSIVNAVGPTKKSE